MIGKMTKTSIFKYLIEDLKGVMVGSSTYGRIIKWRHFQ